MKLTVETRLEMAVAVIAAALVIVGTGLIYPPAALVVAGIALLASLIDLRRSRP